MRRSIHFVLPLVVAAAALWLVIGAFGSEQTPASRSAAPDSQQLYLPSVFVLAPPSPAGSYSCLEYEFGMVWASEVITLNPDGSGIYDFTPPYLSTMTGTWAFVPATWEVQFTNFRWPTATYDAPDRLWASRYLPEPDFEVALECSRLKD